ncbi:MAG: ABC transporter ATP-binding protein [Candidatus Bipolaricaulia bacterium]
MTHVRVDRLTKEFPFDDGARLRALEDLSFEIDDGEFIGVLGRSGCGKSTLLRILAGLDSATRGAVEIRADDSGRGRQPTAMVFQEHVLFPWRTVLGNVTFGLEEQRVPRAEREARAHELIRLVGLAGHERHYPKSLSSGMRQRVGIARALAVDPDVLLMDEPTASLDAQTKMELQDELVRIWAETGKTVVYVTHDVDEAVYLADRVLMLSPHPGRLQTTLPIELPRPRDRVSPEFTELKGELLHRLTDRAAHDELGTTRDGAEPDRRLISTGGSA